MPDITAIYEKLIDLLIEMEKGYIPIEIKMTKNVNKSDAKHLLNLNVFLDKPIIKSFVLSNDNNIKKIGADIIAMPAAMFLS